MKLIKMARNSEKNLSRLNRYVLAKERQTKPMKSGSFKSSRPPLKALKSVEEVKRWMPDITKEIDYCLSQIECSVRRNYSDKMVEEFEERVENLQKEYKSFISRVYQLDPSTKGVPWKAREYVPQRSHRPRALDVAVAPPLISALLEKKKQPIHQEDEDDDTSPQPAPLNCNDKEPSTGICEPHCKSGCDSMHEHSSMRKSDTKSNGPLGLDYSSSDSECND